MADGHRWIALVTLERREEAQAILPDWSHGACGWMVAIAPDEENARRLLVRDVESCGLRVIEIDHVRELFSDEAIEEIDDHLALNLRDIEPGKQTIWGSLHGYKGEGEA